MSGLLNNAALASKLENNLLQKQNTGLVTEESQLLGKQGYSHNPLDRNMDGKVDLKDLTGQPSSGLAHHNPLDRNFDGKVDAKDFGQQRLSQGYDNTLLYNQTAYVQGAKRASLVRAEPTIIETIQKDVVVHERIHPVQKEEIQPVIYREREQLDVKQVTQMLHETHIQPTIVQQRELPAERREAIVERGAPIAENYIAPSKSVDATLRTQVVHAPIVNEVIKKTIIEEIQPVLERDIIQSTVIQNTQPIYEKIVEAPTVFRSTTVVQSRGFVGGDLALLESQGFNLGEAGKRLSGNYNGLSQGFAHNPMDKNFDGKVDYKDFAGQQAFNPLDKNLDGKVDARDFVGSTTTNETLYSSNGLKRRSLVEALPASYSYLGNGLDGKLAQEQMLTGNALNNNSLPSKTVL